MIENINYNNKNLSQQQKQYKDISQLAKQRNLQFNKYFLQNSYQKFILNQNLTFQNNSCFYLKIILNLFSKYFPNKNIIIIEKYTEKILIKQFDISKLELKIREDKLQNQNKLLTFNFKDNELYCLDQFDIKLKEYNNLIVYDNKFQKQIKQFIVLFDLNNKINLKIYQIIIEMIILYNYTNVFLFKNIKILSQDFFEQFFFNLEIIFNQFTKNQKFEVSCIQQQLQKNHQFNILCDQIENKMIIIFDRQDNLLYINHLTVLLKRKLKKYKFNEITFQKIFITKILRIKIQQNLKILKQKNLQQIILDSYGLQIIQMNDNKYQIIIDNEMFDQIEYQQFIPFQLKQQKQIQIFNRIIQIKNKRLKQKIPNYKKTKYQNINKTISQYKNQKSINKIKLPAIQKIKIDTINLYNPSMDRQFSYQTHKKEQVKDMQQRLNIFKEKDGEQLRKSFCMECLSNSSNNDQQSQIVKQNSQCNQTFQSLQKDKFLDKIIKKQKIIKNNNKFFNQWNFDVNLQKDQQFAVIMEIFDPYIVKYDFQQDMFYQFLNECYFYYQRNNNPFHNFSHGVMVCYSTNFMINNLQQLKDNLDFDHKFGFLLGALCHDLDHTGTNNNFEISSESELANRYSDKSPLEYHHLYRLFQLCSKNKFDFFQSFEIKKKKLIREFIIEIIVATDMKFHFCHLENAAKMLENEIDWTKKEILNPISGLILHATDLSHTTKETNTAIKWAKLVNIEFTAINKQEQELSIPQTPYFKDLHIDSVFYKSEMNFLKFIIQPLYQKLGEFFKKNKIFNKINKQIEKNVEFYKSNFEKSN